MSYLFAKSILSGLLVMLISEISRKYPGLGGLIASLPLISLLGMAWLWHDTHDSQRLAAHAQATFWFVLPSLPMFLTLPWLLRREVAFWPALGLCCLLTIACYSATLWLLPRLGISLS